MEPFNTEAGMKTLTLEAVGKGRTRMVSRTRFPSAEALDGALATGTTRGIIDSYDRSPNWRASSVRSGADSGRVLRPPVTTGAPC